MRCPKDHILIQKHSQRISINKLKGCRKTNLCQLDYCNEFFTGIPKNITKKLPLDQNSAAQLLNKEEKAHHFSLRYTNKVNNTNNNNNLLLLLLNFIM